MKKLLLKTMLLLCALIAGSGTMWADDVTLTAASGFGSSYGTDHTFSVSGIGFKDSGVMYNGKNSPSGFAAKQVIQMRKSGSGAGEIYNTAAISTITSVEVTLVNNNNGFTLYYGTTQNPSTNSIASSSLTPVTGTFSYTNTTGGTSSATSYKFTFDLSSYDPTYIKIVNGSSANYVGSIVINYEAGSPSKCETPTFSPAAGAVTIGTSVTISCATDGATIHYTVDGTDPSASSPTYSSAITIDAAKTIKAIAVKGGLSDSGIATAAYTIAQVATPTFDPAAGAVTIGTSVTISCATDGATIHYTVDGTDPTASSPTYSSAITIDAAKTIKAIAVKDGFTNSGIGTAAYTIAEPCATPTFSVAAGEVAKGTTVSLGCATDGATIYYTTDGTTPTTSSTVYSSAITINTAQTIKAIAVKAGNANSAVASASYTIIDYATLPFDYDGNGTGTLPTGLTVSGTGTYSGSPKIKFDGAGDYVILKVGQAPGELKFKIKGNGSGSDPQSGTFKVQTSVDGSSYSDLDSYDTLGDIETKTYTNLDPSTRFIKWVYTTKTLGNVALGGINLTSCESVTVTDAGYATYKTTGKVCFPTGVKGYIATATNASTVTLTSKESVPAGTPIVLKAAEGTYYLPIITSSPETVTDNLLQVSDGSVTGGDNIYALSNVGGTVGFYQVSSDLTIATGKVYLDTSASGAKAFLTFDFDEADGIGSIDNGQLTMDNERIFRLDGTRVNGKITKKGLYIRGGRKVVVR